MSKQKLDIDALLDVYCDGIYAMDPKTALPFWDYDFGPLYGDLWIAKMLKACHAAIDQGLTATKVSSFFENIAVTRKELIYSLVDLKVGNVPKVERLFYVDFWWNVVLEKCKRDCLVKKSNIVHSDLQIKGFISDLQWEKADAAKSRQIGNMAMNLNSLAYGLYTDIFAHNAIENFGAYDVSNFFGGLKYILVIKQWANLKPIELYPEFKDFPYNKLNIFAIYRDIDYSVDIYTHQIYVGNAAKELFQYAVLADDKIFLNDLAKLEEFNDYIGPIVVAHFQKIKQRGFEEAKKSWVLARNYQFKDFFKAVGLEWYDEGMIERVQNKELVRTDFWDFEKYPKDILFRFWKKCFDPRLDTYYQEWPQILNEIVMGIK